jgi:hemerythrin
MLYESELVSWTSSLSSHVKIIDEQHKSLLNLTNDLFNHCLGNEKEESAYFKSVILEAVEYTKNHFKTEEKMMLATKFDGYTNHKHEHDQFILKVVDLVREFNMTGKINLIQFTRFLKDWILAHIANTDKIYFDYFKKLATKKANGQFSIKKEDIERYKNQQENGKTSIESDGSFLLDFSE